MNVTELARILKITPQELRDTLPQIGFDIGQKAIKINVNVAHKIIRQWPELKGQLDRQKAAEEKEKAEEQTEARAEKTITVPFTVTVREFSALSGLSINTVLSELMKNGIFASINEKIDFDTAWLVGSELGIEVKPGQAREEDSNGKEGAVRLKEIIAEESKGDLRPRPPVIVVMGHVDHGKTKLLDAIRRTHVVEGEAGGITQHIGAYQVERNGRLLTFIDTPGHEAFTAMRGRGARIADIAILVVAADDGVKPQTIEACRIIKAAKIPFVVAINKIDKPEANIDKTKQELSAKLQIVPEDWGGKTVCAPISAKEGTGVVELLDMVLLAAETESAGLTANPNARAVGTVIESHVDKGAGPVATILVQNGTLKTGDSLTLDNVIIGKVRCLNDYQGGRIDAAGPSAPARIIGLKSAPQVGDILTVGEGVKVKGKKIKSVSRPAVPAASEEEKEKESRSKKINLIIKADVLGSAEAIEESLEKISSDEVKIKIIRKGLGNITDGDIKRAEAAGAQILGFNVKVPPVIEELAREKNITIKIYRIIYDLINDIKDQAGKLIEPTVRRVELGRVRILAVFKAGKEEQIVGGKVLEGGVEPETIAEILRGQESAGGGRIVKLQSAREDVRSVDTDQECGIEYAGDGTIQKGDILVVSKEEKITKK